MPELPEVETIRCGLERTVVGKTIIEIKVLRPKSWQGDKNLVIGQKVKAVKRQAKVLLLELDNKVFILIHLKMTGQLIWSAKKPTRPSLNLKPEGNRYDVDQLPNKYTRVIIQFKDNSCLYFNDLRVFGWLKAIKQSELGRELKNFSGLEPFDRNFTVKYLDSVLTNSRRAIKLSLLDQKKIAGIGNIYANETLFCAGIDPRRPSNQMKLTELKKLRQCIIKVLKAGIKHGGTTDSDEAFRNLEGDKGQMQNYLRVYARAGQKCFKCQEKIGKIKLGGRGTFFCPQCQK